MLYNAHLLDNLNTNQYKAPNDGQVQILDCFNNNENAIIIAPTGKGKTVSLVIHLIDYLSQNNDVQAFFVLPTKELINQVFDVFKFLTKNIKLNIRASTKSLHVNAFSNANLVLITPDKLKSYSVFLGKNIHKKKYMLVLDEADTLIEMGFVEDLKFFLKFNKKFLVRKIAASATIPKNLFTQLKLWFKDYGVVIDESKKVVKSQHYYLITREEKKLDDLLVILNYVKEKTGTILFCNSKSDLLDLHQKIKIHSDFRIVLFHGDLTEQQRKKTLSFINNNEQVVVFATELLGRGISIKHIETVINFDLPKTDD